MAIVGNGPLSEAQRERVAGADTSLRFNRLGDGWPPGDGVDILLTRHRGGDFKGYPPDQPFFLPHIPKHANDSLPASCLAEAAAVLASASLLLAAGNSRFDVPPSDLTMVALGAGMPAGALDGKLAVLPVAQLARRFTQWAADATGGAAAPIEPSSGLLGAWRERDGHWYMPLCPAASRCQLYSTPDPRPATSAHPAPQASSLC